MPSECYAMAAKVERIIFAEAPKPYMTHLQYACKDVWLLLGFLERSPMENLTYALALACGLPCYPQGRLNARLSQ